jgi:hypothetical protein
VAGGALDERLEPALRGDDVVVHERDQRGLRFAQAGVAGGVEAAPLAVAHAAHAEAPGDLAGGVRGPVVDDEELVRRPGALAAERVERDLEVRRAAARRDHDRDRRLVHRRIA